jgi:sulfoxide reductase heme-binding subunit YedZ
MVSRRLLLRWLSPAAFIAALVPLLLIGYDAFLGGGLGANPIESILNRLGFWTLTLLTITLACTPAKIVFGITWPLRIRRLLGLFAFFYAVLHFATYFAIDQFFDLRAIYEDVIKRKFITVGFVALLLLIPLAVTSTNRAVRRMGFRRWKRLHRLAYVIVGLGLIHFVWRVKADLREPLIFTGVIGVLMAIRLVGWARGRRAGAGRRRRSSPSRPDAAPLSARG